MATDLGQGWGGGCFGTEETAVALEGNWISGYLRDKAPNLPYGTTLMPKDPVSGERGNLIFTVSWGIKLTAKILKQHKKRSKSSPAARRRSGYWILDWHCQVVKR
ncbi:extracellular solute-binding protein family 1 [Vibrio astriarenae]|nr:extracellular solute-binding protein family 1 [Vibrio sp. C7]